MHNKLFIPGPVDVRPDVLEAMSGPMMSHRGKPATALQKGISDKLKKVFQTENVIVLSTTSGSGLMESAVRCCTAKKAAIFSVGSFGDRWYKMATANGVPADKFRAEDGQSTLPEQVDEVLKTGEYDLITVTHNETSSGVMTPVGEIGKIVAKYPDVVFCVDTVSSMGGVDIKVDAWGIDFCITSTQKCLGLPPGLAIASVSQKAYDRAKTVKNRGLYLDIVEIYDKVVEKDAHQYPSTPSLSHMYALEYQLDYIMNKEGLENRWARHAELAQIARDWATKHFKLFSNPAYLSNTVTCVENTKGIDAGALGKALEAKGYIFSNGYGSLKDKTFRIAHMADMDKETLVTYLKTIEEILGL